MKITTGFNPVEANFLLQMCYARLRKGDNFGPNPKIPVSIPQPSGWGPWEDCFTVKNNLGFCIWQNEINRNQFALLFHGPTQDVPTLTSSENTGMSVACIQHEGKVLSLCPDSNAKCNTRFLQHFQLLFKELQKSLSRITAINELYIAGHSTGAALATLAICSLQQYSPFTTPLLGCKSYLFGSPKIGNTAFTNYLSQLNFNNSNIDSLAFNIQNANDLICELPQTFALHPKLQGNIKSFRQRFIHGISRLLYPSRSSTNVVEPYAHFGTPVILPSTSLANKTERDPVYQHDMRHYFQLLNQHYPI